MSLRHGDTVVYLGLIAATALSLVLALSLKWRQLLPGMSLAARWMAELRPASSPRSIVALLSWVLVTVEGCGGGTQIVTPPPPPPAANLSVALVPDSEDLTPATALGWAAGLPGAEVRLQSTAPGSSSQSFTSTPQGKVPLTGFAPGVYSLEASRWLTTAERVLLPNGDATTGFAIRTTVRLESSGEVRVTVPASRRSGLVISEWGFASIYTPSTGSYEFGGFLELYNNGDTTAYLDGLLVGEAVSQGVEFPNLSCATVATLTDDPSGLWVRKLARFPGSGRQYPVPPGGVVVVATDAIDHRPLTPGGLDLSAANFEFFGPQDVDNPAVPNMLDVGLFSSWFGHGLDFNNLWSVPFLARSADPATFVRQRPAFWSNGAEAMKVPAASILDAAALLATYEFPNPLCPQLVNRAIDRGTARLIASVDAATGTILSIHRIRPAGHAFLQDTRRSESDFIAAPRTPGRVQ